MTLPTGRACLLAATGAFVALAAVPPAARATTTCTYAPTGKLVEVLMPAADDRARLRVDAGAIRVLGAADQPLTCAGGTPTVTNTSVITVVADGKSGHSLAIESPSLFAPGADTASENGGTPEIEIFVNLRDGPGSRFSIVTGSAGESVRFGTGGINPNAAPGEIAPDADIIVLGVARHSLFGGDGADALGAHGGAGTGRAFADGVELLGGDANDVLVGGEGPDVIDAGDGTDALFGMGGNDTLNPGAGEGTGVADIDTTDGGEGIDRATYGSLAFSVSVDLASGGMHGLSADVGDVFIGVEDVTGTVGADVLRGEAGANTLDGREGDDVLEGRGGPDILTAGEGDDSLDVRDGGPDIASCGNDQDTVIADLPGVDTLVACESVLFAQPPGADDGTPPVAPAQPGPLEPPPPDLPPVLIGLKVAPAAFPAFTRRGGSGAARGARVSYVLSEAATTTFTVERAVPGRRAGRGCVRPTRRTRGARRCTRWIGQRGSVTRDRQQGANSFRFTGRLSRRALAVGSYRLNAQARDSGGQRSRTVSRGFRIVR